MPVLKPGKPKGSYILEVSEGEVIEIRTKKKKKGE
jgi:hypothetical protein